MKGIRAHVLVVVGPGAPRDDLPTVPPADGYEFIVHCVDSGQALGEIADVRRHDYILIDLPTVGRDAARLCRRLASRHDGAVLLALGDDEDLLRRDALARLGVADVLPHGLLGTRSLARALLLHGPGGDPGQDDVAAAHALLAAVLDSVQEGIVVTDPQGRELLASRKAATLLGTAGLPERARRLLANAPADVATETEVELADGRSLIVSPRPLTSGEGTTFGGVLTLRPMPVEPGHATKTDPLAAIPNRTAFKEHMSAALGRCHRSGTRLAVLLMDLDRFKAINDTLGHETGDALVAAVARRLKATVRAGDYVARLSGDEFAVLMEDIKDSAEAAQLANRILEGFRERFTLGEREIYATASIGIAVYPNCGADIGSLLKAADVAMFKAKEKGRATFHYYSDHVHEEIARYVNLHRDLTDAVERGEFELYYQPMYDLVAEKVIGFEALLRWHHPELGMVSPAEFVPILEATGLIVPVGDWVMVTACRQLSEWRAQYKNPALTMAVNLSTRQLDNRDLPARICAILSDAGLPPGSLELEVTESLLMQNPDDTAEILRDLVAAGVRLSIDDFGTGYSSIRYLRFLPVGALKLDRSFVAAIPDESFDGRFVRAIVSFAHNLGLRVTGEGVETPEQLEFLREIGCHYIQGYHIGAPVEAGRAARHLEVKPRGSSGLVA